MCYIFYLLHTSLFTEVRNVSSAASASDLLCPQQGQPCCLLHVPCSASPLFPNQEVAERNPQGLLACSKGGMAADIEHAAGTELAPLEILCRGTCIVANTCIFAVNC